MKKTLALVLALVLCLGAFAACGESDEKAPAAKGATLEEAKSYLFNMFKDNAEAPSVDFDVVAKVIIDGTPFDVTWSASIEEVKVIESKRESFWTVDLPFKNEAEKDYTLTATIKDAKGDTIEPLGRLCNSVNFFLFISELNYNQSINQSYKKVTELSMPN